MNDTPDARLTPARPDRAAAFLRGQVTAAEFVAGESRSVTAPLAPLRRVPQWDASLVTEALRGEIVTVYEENTEGWAWVQLQKDRYVGYMPSSMLGTFESATHRVMALRTFIYPGPSMKLPVAGALTLGASCRPARFVDGFAALPEGFVWTGHLGPIESHEPDFVAVAERFIGVPYLWGGKSSLGLDCSGLVQLALAATGVEAARDSDMQENGLGRRIMAHAALQRGDLVFWKGHVGIMRDHANLLHANAHTMMVTTERLDAARMRIRAASRSEVTSFKRLDGLTRA